jgi:hypothetical protein
MALDAWGIRQSDNPSRSAAICRLLEEALPGVAPGRRGSATRRASRAAKMAGEQIDRMLEGTDQSDSVKAKRKDRLLKGPNEFRKR